MTFYNKKIYTLFKNDARQEFPPSYINVSFHTKISNDMILDRTVSGKDVFTNRRQRRLTKILHLNLYNVLYNSLIMHEPRIFTTTD